MKMILNGTVLSRTHPGGLTEKLFIFQGSHVEPTQGVLLTRTALTDPFFKKGFFKANGSGQNPIGSINSTSVGTHTYPCACVDTHDLFPEVTSKDST